MTAVNLFLVLDTLADLLGLLAILQAWSYVWRSCPHQMEHTRYRDYTGLGSCSPYVQFEGGSLCIHMLGYSVLRVAMR
jgi:hypothetical protein